MRVLQINSVCGIRSTGRICTDIADVLGAKGHECKIAYGRENVPDRYQRISYRIGSNFEVNINGIKARLLDNEGFNAKRQTRQLIEFIKEYKPDIIHLHNLHGYYINLEILLTYLAESQIPTVCTMHDCWAVTGHCAYFTTAKCERWKTGCYDCPQKKIYPASYLFDRSKINWLRKRELFRKVAMTLVSPSHWLADILRESYLGVQNILVIPNGIDISAFCPTESSIRDKLEIGNGKVILGVASGWGDRKGLPDFIELAKILNPQDRIILVGLTEEQKRSLPASMIGITRTNNEQELAALYSAADVFVNPTHQDNYPTVNLEARACGTPVITYDTGGSPESAGKDAVVVKVGDIEGLKMAIDATIKSRDTINSSSFSKEYMAEQYINVYKKLSGSREL